jgi:hypothetical protein
MGTYVLLSDILGALSAGGWSDQGSVEGGGVQSFSGRDYSFGEGGVVVPERFMEGLDRFMGGMADKFGMYTFLEKMRPVPGQFDQFCIENPFQDFNGISFPSMRACVNFGELAQQVWVQPLRLLLLFMCICQFVISVFTVLWAG